MNSNPNENGNIEIDVNVADEYGLSELLIEIELYLLIVNLLFSNMDINPNQNEHIEIDVGIADDGRIVSTSQ